MPYNERKMKPMVKYGMNMRLASLLVICLAFLLTAGLHAEEKQVLETKVLSLHMAQRVAAAALHACDEMGYQVGVAVVGRNGNLVAFLRNPLAGPHTIDISQKKAYTSASTRVPTAQLTDRRTLNFADRLITVQGGLPINLGGYLYGGVGVSGATSEDDEVCAQVGIDAIKEDIEFGD